jgi:Insertion element 4 transposase N-terminal/Transposase DDE domain
MGGRWSSTRGKILAGVRIGVPARWVTPGLVDEVLAEAGQAGPGGQRFRALPARLGVYWVLGLCLFGGVPYREVLRKLASGLGGALAAAGWQAPSSTALTGLRRRLGEKPFELLLGQLRGPLSPGTAPWSHICGLLAVAWDGTTVAAPASAANIACFGRLRGKKGGHYPLVRLVTLIACGTRALAGAAIGPVRGKGSGEQVLARDLLGSLREGMLLLADRNFYGYQLWNAAAGTGADLLWRVKASLHLPVVRPLPDGSWLSVIPDPAAVRRRTVRNGKRRRRGSKLPPDAGPLPGITVRVIEFWLAITADDGTVRTGRYRLITTLLDHRACPAAALAAGYAQRWAIEIGHRWCRSSRAVFSWLRSFVVAGFLAGRCPAGAGVEARRVCPALA